MKKDSPAKVMPGPLSSADLALAADPLPSWKDGPTKQSIFSFVEKVTQEGSPSFVPVPERIATFDNDGTLWCETPVPVQVYFALDRVKVLASQHPAREYAYGPAQGLPKPQLGSFSQALYEQAKGAGWTVVSMKEDWKQMFPSQSSAVTAINILLEPEAAE